MSKKTKNTKLAIILAAVLVIVVGAFAWLYFAHRPKTVKGAKHITVEVVHNGTKTYEYDTDAEFLRQVLCEENGLISGTEGEFGLFIDTVDGYKNDSEKQEWWCITKGGETIMTGVDEIAISDGDKYEITLMVGYDSF